MAALRARVPRTPRDVHGKLAAWLLEVPVSLHPQVSWLVFPFFLRKDSERCGIRITWLCLRRKGLRRRFGKTKATARQRQCAVEA